MTDEQQVVQQQQAVQSYPQTTINLTNEGMVLSISLAPGTALSHGIASETMHTITRQWIEAHEELLQDVIKRALEAKKEQLQVVRSHKKGK